MRIVLCYLAQSHHVERIAAVAPDAEIVNASQETIPDAILGADLFCGHAKVPMPWDKVVAGGRLKWIQSSAAGLDHCLVPPVIASDIVVTSASGLFADQVAEQTAALLFGVVRSAPRFFRQGLDRQFVRRPTGDVTGKTVGIIGLGGNGRRIVETLLPYRVRILATDWFPVDRPVGVESLLPASAVDEILPECDIVILTMPLTEVTARMFDQARIAKMKPGSYLINVARGPVVVESALVEALQTGHLAGAGLDVTEVEPLPEASPLWDMPNVMITPHVGAQSARRIDDATALFCENLARWREGRPLINRVDKQLGFPERRPTDAFVPT